ncbi:unnamed protein product [Peronospora belbahrii]|uniref:NF-kappa-B-activating protein C-terminal domain-containing protein n=1 Tax=Peronospora belbahrii TaxID=622444 RepID=A0AAU9L5K2_9STRA|nr:unnamed protein product [Peronospora belbahrii]CAH0515078.1 unnamed protein product [Peronospora belbahrii]
MGRYGPMSGFKSNGNRSRGGGRYNNDQTDDFFEDRKKERDAIEFSIWADIPSPVPVKKKPTKAKPMLSPFRSRSRSVFGSRSSSCNDSDVSGSDTEEERRRHQKSKRKAKSSRRSHKKKGVKKSKKHKKDHKRSRKRRKRAHSESSSGSSHSDHGSDVSVASDGRVRVDYRDSTNDLNENEKKQANKFKEAVQGSRHDNDEEEEIGPKPLVTAEETAASTLNYGKALLPGEGAAIAQFVQKNMRIPRRGEVGWNGEEIENLENLGYVMSGSRHKRMNAVRIRKENQVYTAEEKRALALINFEEKQQRENAIMNDFKEMLTERLTKKHGSRLVEDMESSAKD